MTETIENSSNETNVQTPHGEDKNDGTGLDALPADLAVTDPDELRRPPEKRKERSRDEKEPRKQIFRKVMNSELLEGAEYVKDHAKGLRRVVPYFWTFKTNVKGRWLGMTLEKLFTTEFRDRTPDHYRRAILAGKIEVNGEAKALGYKLRNGDVLTHTSHRHEPAVTLQAPQIVHMDDDIIVVNKPAGIPVHPTGRYRHNSVLNILSIEFDVSPNVAPCNRLDRLTSGLMFFSQNPKMADKMRKHLFERDVSKVYVARVVGEFPDTTGKDDILVDLPIKSVNPLYGLNRVHPDGKTAQTSFRRLSYNGATSVVMCMPKTGRTHQIRVHLQWLGHPIANDPIYANRNVWGDDPGASSKELGDAEVENALNNVNKTECPSYGRFTVPPPATHEGKVYMPETKADAAIRRDRRIGELLSGEECEICEAPLYTDPIASELCIFLHAWKYSADDGAWAGLDIRRGCC
ncbi:DRAP deaminase [Savitreella phatthalungensis]